MHNSISSCRLCGNSQLISVFNLGEQDLTGIFPKDPGEKIPSAPLHLVKCHGDNCCGLVQLKETLPVNMLYGRHYGYRSGSNPVMAAHLKAHAQSIMQRFTYSAKDLIVDIGSNDGTFINYCAQEGLKTAAFDPIAGNFKHNVNVSVVPDFFSEEKYRAVLGDKQSNVVTAFAVIYDLEDPLKFFKDVFSILDDDGVFVMETGYTPALFEKGVYDAICHEHYEYYGLQQVAWMADATGFYIEDIDFNTVNGCSVACYLRKGKSSYSRKLQDYLLEEDHKGFNSLGFFLEFEKKVNAHREQLKNILDAVKKEGKNIIGFGASTKGNVLLQYCDIDHSILDRILEVNRGKFGCLTPGTHIPIVNEEGFDWAPVDTVLVLPWHYEQFILEKISSKIDRPVNIIFPFPEIRVVSLEPARSDVLIS